MDTPKATRAKAWLFTVQAQFKSTTTVAKYILVGLELPPSQRSPRQGVKPSSVPSKGPRKLKCRSRTLCYTFCKSYCTVWVLTPRQTRGMSLQFFRRATGSKHSKGQRHRVFPAFTACTSEAPTLQTSVSRKADCHAEYLVTIGTDASKSYLTTESVLRAPLRWLRTFIPCLFSRRWSYQHRC
jgi:hypothetical protein